MKYKFFLFFWILAGHLMSQEVIEPCKFGQPLIQVLQNSYTPSSSLGYNNGRDTLYARIDNDGLDLSGIYTAFTVTLNPNADPSVSAYQNGAGINAEHVYPQSKGAGNEPAKSDLHNIFPSKVNVNEARGSCIFGEVEDSDTDRWFYLSIQANNIPSSDIDNYSEKEDDSCVFEPREMVKGDIARAVFYFYTIYQNIADAADPNFFPAQKDALYQWHLADPVDAKEQRRDSLIAFYQGNHNPFILDSTLVRRAFFSADASYPSGDPNCEDGITMLEKIEQENWVRIASNWVDDSVRIFSKKENGNVLLYDLRGQMVQRKNLQTETLISMKNLPRGNYILRIQSEGAEQIFRVFKF